jgi:dihydroorotase
MRRIPILLLAAALPLAAQQYDLLIQGGRVIDPANGIDAVMDVAVLGETIAGAATARNFSTWWTTL